LERGGLQTSCKKETWARVTYVKHIKIQRKGRITPSKREKLEGGGQIKTVWKGPCLAKTNMKEKKVSFIRRERDGDSGLGTSLIKGPIPKGGKGKRNSKERIGVLGRSLNAVVERGISQ